MAPVCDAVMVVETTDDDNQPLQVKLTCSIDGIHLTGAHSDPERGDWLPPQRSPGDEVDGPTQVLG